MGKRITVRIDDPTNNFLNKFENKSEFLREIIMDYFSDPKMLQLKLNEVNKKLEENEIEHIELAHQQQILEKEIKEIEDYTSSRPDGYEEVVSVLLDMDDICSEDIKFQAEQIGCSYKDFRRMLYYDGHYEKIMRTS